MQDKWIRVTEDTWVTQAFERSGNKCDSCGCSEGLAARLVVPEADGGLAVLSNSIVNCRTCELATVKAQSDKDHVERRFNFLVSRVLSDFIDSQSVRRGKADYLRSVMTLYLGNPSRFPDVLQYQDSAVEAKINFSLDLTLFNKFTSAAVGQGSNTSELLRGIILSLKSEKEGL